MSFRIGIVSLFLLCISYTGFAQSFEIYDGDTINRVSENRRKNGRWIIFGKDEGSGEYQPDQIVEEGEYSSSRKVGVWKKYHPNGNLESEITFSRGRPSGEYKVYYENGQIQEQGNWQNNRNTGKFTRWHENGELQQEFNFTPMGKRSGEQKYYHDNGQLMIIGNWDEGKEDGEITEYYSNGDIKSVKVFNGGAIDGAKTKKFMPKAPLVQEEKEPDVPEKKSEVVAKDIKPNSGQLAKPWDGNGYHTLYNRNKQLSMKGVFKSRRLKDGMKYVYDENGILVNIEKYKNFKYIGDAPLENDDEDQ